MSDNFIAQLHDACRSCRTGSYALLLLLLGCVTSAVGQGVRPITVSYTLSDSASTSAGLFDQDSTLLATLWSARLSPPGTFSTTITPTDQTGRALPPGNYHVRVLASRVRYSWQGVLANSSATAQVAPAQQHRAFQPIQAMACLPNKAYAALGYAEGNPAQISFATANPQARTELFAKGTTDQASRLVATDGQAVYWGGYEGVSNGGRWFVFATSASTDAELRFASGRPLQMQYGRTYSSCLDVIESANGRMGGLAVQARGRFLFVSHPALHQLRVFDKQTGSLVSTEFVNDGGALAIDSQDRLWVIDGATVVRYSVSDQGRLSGVEQRLSGLVAPVALAVRGQDNTVAVLEGGARQQLRGYRGDDGAALWVRGVAGGYLSDPVVSDEKFYVSDGLGVSEGVFVTYGSDGSLWVGDGGNYRVQHFGPGGSNGPGSLVDRIQYQPHSYSSQVVGNSGGVRVLGEYLEYAVDYSRSAVGGWTLVRNWRGAVPAAYFGERSLNYLFLTDILKDATTLKNGRTYGLLKQVSTNRWEVVELPPTGPIRFTGLFLPNAAYHIAPDGSLNQAVSFPSGVGGSIRWQKRLLTGFDDKNNPIWVDAVTVARIQNISPLDPVDFTGFGSMRPGLSTSNGTIISFNKNKLSSDGSNGYGFHLGGIRPGTNRWAWRAAYATTKDYTGDYPTDGAYDIGNNVEYGGGDVTVSGRHIFWNYHGEFWKNSQTNKWHHVYDDGLVVGTFGKTGPEALQESPDRSPVPGMAGNVFYGTATAGPDGAIYIYHAEESGHGGIHRWRVDGLETLREQVIPVTVSAPGQHGLTGAYTTDTGLNNANTILTRIDPVPVLPTTKPLPGMARAQTVSSSVRWTGFVAPPTTGTYTFYVTTNQGTRLWVDNKLLVDSPQAKQSATYRQTVDLEAGVRYPIRLESFGGNQLTLDWSTGTISRQTIDSTYLWPAVASSTPPGLDLLDGLTSGTSLIDGLYGWQRSPAQEDLTDINSKYWSLRTGIKTYDRFQSPDLNIRFRQNKAVHTVVRNLGDSTRVNETWRLSAILNQEETFFNTDEGRNRNGGLYIDVLDDAGRLLVRFNNQVTLASPVTGRLFVNGKLIAQGDYNNIMAPLVQRNQPIDISVHNGQVTVKYGPYPAVTAPLSDGAGNWRKPRQVRLYFWGDGYNVNRVINLQNLRFYTDLAAAQIILSADDELDQLTATPSVDNIGILVSTDGGPFVSYTEPIQVGDVERPAGYWRFRFDTASGTASQIVYSPPFTIQSESLLLLWPNPTDDQLTIGHPVVGSSCALLLYAADGKLVQQWIPATGSTTTSTSVRHLPAGSYIVRFVQDQQQLSARLLIRTL